MKVSKKAIKRAKADLNILQNLYNHYKNLNQAKLMLNNSREMSLEQLGEWVECQKEHLEILLKKERLQKLERFG